MTRRIPLVATFLIVIGAFAPVLRWPAVVVLTLTAGWGFVNRRALMRALAGIAMYVALSRRDKVDWVFVRRVTGAVFVAVLVAVFPRSVGGVLVGVGVGMMAAFATAPLLPQRAAALPGYNLARAWRFRFRYPRTARELGWDKGRRGNMDRRSIPRLRHVRVDSGGWSLHFTSRGDWARADWDDAVDALTRHLGGTTAHIALDGSRALIRVWTRPLPSPGDIRVTEPPRVTRDGFLVGHDGGGRPVHWSADDRSANGIITGPIGSGKSYMMALPLLAAAASPGWDAEVLDGKQTHDWDWMTAYGVRVTRTLPQIGERLRALEGERVRIEAGGGGAPVRRLIVLDEAVPVLSDDAGDDRAWRLENAGIVNRLTGLGRSAGFRMLLAVQRPDVRLMGSGYARDNMPFRAAFGRMSPKGLGMVFPDGGWSDAERELMDGTPGRALVTGHRVGSIDVFVMQVPELVVDRPDVRVPDPPVAPGGDGLRGDVLAAMGGREAWRADVCRALGREHRDPAVRAAVRALADDGVIRVETRGNRVRLIPVEGVAGGVV